MGKAFSMVRSVYCYFITFISLVILSLWQSLSYAGATLSQADSTSPQPLTITTFSYQSNGDLQNQTLSWANVHKGFQLNNVKQQTTQEFYSSAEANSLCRTELPATLASISPDLICLSQTHYLQTTPGNNTNATPITRLGYMDSRTGVVRAKVDPMDHVTLYDYDQLGRETKMTQGNQVIAIDYLNAGDPSNKTGYNQVVVSYPNGPDDRHTFKRRMLINGLGQLVDKQVNTCPDGPNAIPGCSAASDYGTTAIVASDQGGFRNLVSDSYQNDGIIQPQIQSSTDALGATTQYQYDSLGRRTATITTTTTTKKSANDPVSVVHGIIYDKVNRLQINYPQVPGSVNPGDPHVVQAKYFNAINKVSQTRSIPLYKLQQAIQKPANELFTAVNQGALERYLVSIKNQTAPAPQVVGWLQTTRYDSLLQKQLVTGGLQQAAYTYSGRGLVNTATNSQKMTVNNKPLDNQHYQRQFKYNLLGKVITSTLTSLPSHSAPLADDADNTHTGATHSYNSLGELTRLTSYAQQDPRQTPLLNSVFGYNDDGRLTSRLNDYQDTVAGIVVGSSQINYYRSYDDQGRPTASWDVRENTSANLTTSDCKVWTYYQPGNSQDQPLGKLQSMTFSCAQNGDPDTVTYSYYPDGALKQVSYKDGLAISYQYDAAGHVTQVSYSQGGVLKNQSHYQYGRGTAHRLLSVTSGVNPSAPAAKVTYQYNDLGNPIKISRTSANLSVTTVKTYNGYDLLATSTNCSGASCQAGSPQAQQQIDYDYIQGQLSQVTVRHFKITIATPDYDSFNYIKTYSYDGLNRLTGINTTSIDKLKILNHVSYDLDINNNIKSISSYKPVSYHYNAIDQLINKTDSTWQPDYIAGNLTNSPEGVTYRYNNLNQLIQYTNPQGNVTNYQYYPDGTLQSESQGPTNKLTFYYSGGKIALVQDSDGSYVTYLGGLTREGAIYHHAGGKNHVMFYAYQGKTTSGWLGSNGAVWQQRNPYGLSEAIYTSSNPSASSVSPLSLANDPRLMGFNGEYQDAVSHTVFMGIRNYSPALGRFLQLDSYDVANRYAYAQDNPVVNDDPSGHFSLPRWLKSVLSIGSFLLGTLVSGGDLAVGAGFAFGVDAMLDVDQIASGHWSAARADLIQLAGDAAGALTAGAGTAITEALDVGSGVLAAGLRSGSSTFMRNLGKGVAGTLMHSPDAKYQLGKGAFWLHESVDTGFSFAAGALTAGPLNGIKSAENASLKGMSTAGLFAKPLSTGIRVLTKAVKEPLMQETVSLAEGKGSISGKAALLDAAGAGLGELARRTVPLSFNNSISAGLNYGMGYMVKDWNLDGANIL